MNNSAFFDSHVHFQLAKIEDSPEMNTVAGCCCATKPSDWNATLAVSRRYLHFSSYIGVHPWFLTSDINKTIRDLEKLLLQYPQAGIGEIGLDRFRADSPIETQRIWFREQLSLAAEYMRPVSIHCVRSWGPLIEELSNAPRPLPPFFIHSFNGSKEIMQQIIKLGGSISFSPFSLNGKTQKSALNLSQIDSAALLLDTDFPYKKDQPISEYLPLLSSLYNTAAKIRKTQVNELSNIINQNMKPFLTGVTT